MKPILPPVTALPLALPYLAFAAAEHCKVRVRTTLHLLLGILCPIITIATPGVLGEPEICCGWPAARIRNLIFENLTLAGKPVRAPESFHTNEFVEGLVFLPSAVSKP